MMCTEREKEKLVFRSHLQNTGRAHSTTQLSLFSILNAGNSIQVRQLSQCHFSSNTEAYVPACLKRSVGVLTQGITNLKKLQSQTSRLSDQTISYLRNILSFALPHTRQTIAQCFPQFTSNKKEWRLSSTKLSS